MVKALAEIGGIDDGDNATKVFHGVDAQAVNGTFIEWRHNGGTQA